ncbi:MAG: FtsX-like permease family protein [Syntrophobacteraceae bacterium]|jgi:ABC-type lipoprotein release transport system permease subunit|nr:FtsX-like permease family protein [Syntrophobacteraceae bacterium]
MRWIEKQKNILDFTLSALWRRKGKNLVLITVYTFVIFLVASVVFLTSSIKGEASRVLIAAPDMMVQRLVAGRHDYVPLRYADVIREIRGVQSVEGRLWGYYFDQTNNANYTLMVNDELGIQPGTILAGSGVARNLLVREAGSLPFRAYDGSYVFLKIERILSEDLDLVAADLILLSRPDFRRIFLTPEGQATDLVLRVKNAGEMPTIARKIVALLPDTRPILREEILRTYDAVFEWRGGLSILVLSGAFLAFLILAWDKATGLSAEEKREIGVLKGLGWETSDILQLKFWEGVAISLTAFLAGLLLAYAHVFFTPAVLFEPAIKGWSVLYPRFQLTPHLSAYHVVTLFFLTVIPYTVSTIIPSWRAATVDPDIVMRA